MTELISRLTKDVVTLRTKDGLAMDFQVIVVTPLQSGELKAIRVELRSVGAPREDEGAEAALVRIGVALQKMQQVLDQHDTGWLDRQLRKTQEEATTGRARFLARRKRAVGPRDAAREG